MLLKLVDIEKLILMKFNFCVKIKISREKARNNYEIIESVN